MVSLIPACDNGRMGGTWAEGPWGGLSSLAFETDVYEHRSDGSLYYRGPRPGAGWYSHGSFRRELSVLVGGLLRVVKVTKHRWLHVATGRTCHDRPPDEVPWLRFCTLVVAVKLWAWLDGGRGVSKAPVVIDDQDDRAVPRTQQRWLARALPYAMRLQQAVRRAVIERSEPRPVETMFPGGLSPPGTVMRRSWRVPPAVEKLWRGLAFLMGGALRFQIPTAVLLAEARGRWDETTDQQAP